MAPRRHRPRRSYPTSRTWAPPTKATPTPSPTRPRSRFPLLRLPQGAPQNEGEDLVERGPRRLGQHVPLAQPGNAVGEEAYPNRQVEGLNMAAAPGFEIGITQARMPALVLDEPEGLNQGHERVPDPRVAPVEHPDAAIADVDIRVMQVIVLHTCGHTARIEVGAPVGEPSLNLVELT